MTAWNVVRNPVSIDLPRVLCIVPYLMVSG